MFEKEESRTISRVLYSCLFKNARHLSTPDVTIRLYRSTLQRMARLELSTFRRTAATSPWPPVGSYPTFSPLPSRVAAVIFFYVIHALADIFPLGRELPCVARTFLPRQ